MNFLSDSARLNRLKKFVGHGFCEELVVSEFSRATLNMDYRPLKISQFVGLHSQSFQSSQLLQIGLSGQSRSQNGCHLDQGTTNSDKKFAEHNKFSHLYIFSRGRHSFLGSISLD
jgi:hypothetical protein